MEKMTINTGEWFYSIQADVFANVVRVTEEDVFFLLQEDPYEVCYKKELFEERFKKVEDADQIKHLENTK